MTGFVELDVRPILRAGGEPFGKIMETVKNLPQGQGLRLIASFKPTPLLQVLGSQGFTHQAREIGGGDWQVDFTPGSAAGKAPQAAPARPATEGNWPAPIQELDNRLLDPPEPMVRVLAATESMAPGEVLAALLCREPVFLFKELAKRGHAWRGAFEPDGRTYRLLVRIGGTPGEAA